MKEGDTRGDKEEEEAETVEKEPAGGDQKREPSQQYCLRIEARIGVDKADEAQEARQGTEQQTNTPRNAPGFRQAILAYSNVITAFATVGILVATIVYACYAKHQWEVMQGQLTAMQKANRQTGRNITVAQRAAEAAERSANIAERTLEYAERAWVMYKETGPLAHPGEEKQYLDVINDTLEVQLSFFNAGKGPAFNIVAATDYLIANKDTPPPCHVIQVSFAPPARAVLAGGGQGFPLTPRKVIPINANDFAALEETKEKRLYLYGLITYEDTFQHPRQTQFCVVHIPNSEGGGFGYCSCGNVLE